MKDVQKTNTYTIKRTRNGNNTFEQRRIPEKDLGF